jgi:glutathione synthase
VGGRVVATEITERERAICAALTPRLKADGIYFAGIDIIGDFMTEINVTSPTGIREMSELDGVDYSDRWIAWIEESLDARGA